ncbi:hypothetical protein [Robbsia andropogonis]|uniref:hypothetical protein n=1 Tax=Robbsia andropogonis TaxID=28092 RepID=UPI0012F73972|nr:hypothetical protein [Robbsia andropogonis]
MASATAPTLTPDGMNDASMGPTVPVSPISRTGPCCGPVSARAADVLSVIDTSDVTHRWRKGEHIAWDTGLPDRSEESEARYAQRYPKGTHCSAYVAAIGQRLGIYMLRPPAHSQVLLASAQTAWFGSGQGRQAGWLPVASAVNAQALANAGYLVVASYPSPDPHRPGHIGVVRADAARTVGQIDADGVLMAQAGDTNAERISARLAFSAHHGAWPAHIQYFAHPLAVKVG